MNRHTPRIRDVARVAGVSTATVSRALSRPEVVSAATLETVLAAVERTGYNINQAARNLRLGEVSLDPADPRLPNLLDLEAATELFLPAD